MSNKCKESCSDNSIIFEQESEKIAQLMQEQVSLIKNGNTIYNSYLSDKKEEILNDLNDIVIRLREIRDVLNNEIERYENFVYCCKNEKNSDIEILIGYYIEAGSKKEEEFLKTISNSINTKDDLVSLRALILRLKSNKNLGKNI